ISQQWSLIPRAVVRSLSIGDIRNAIVELDEEGCRVAMRYVALAQNSSSKFDDVKPAESSSSIQLAGIALINSMHDKPMICRLASTTIAWRIGNEYLIDATDITDEKYKTESKLNFLAANKFDEVKSTLNSLVAPSQQHTEADSKQNEFVSDLTYALNSKFSLPASHVLSWSVAEP
ncbi:MAG: hypothetical protein ACXW1C_05130, partial [Gallionella sp.]